MTHTESHPLAGKTVKIKANAKHFQVEDFGGADFRVEDYWDKVSGKSWMFCDGNPACMIYAIRSSQQNIPLDDEVLYGKIGPFGHLVHVCELDV